MYKFIENHYYNAEAEYFKSSEKYASLINEIQTCEDELREKMGEADKAEFSHYLDKTSELYAMFEKDSYINGFRNGALCILDILNE